MEIRNFHISREFINEQKQKIEHVDLQSLKNKEKEKNSYSKDYSKEDVEKIVHQLNHFLEPVRTNLKFEFHDSLERYYVTIIDSNTDEIIREVPPKKILDVYAAMAEFMGFLVDEKI